MIPHDNSWQIPTARDDVCIRLTSVMFFTSISSHNEEVDTFYRSAGILLLNLFAIQNP